MPATFDPAQDYLAWDHLEPLTYFATGGGLLLESGSGLLLEPGVGLLSLDGLAVPVAAAKRRPLTRRELAASGGDYLALDRVFLVPAALLPGVACVPADTLTDGDGVTYTVLSSEQAVWRTVWRLTCRDPIIAYALADLIDVQAPALTYDAAGAKVKTWPDDPSPGGSVAYAALACRVQPQSEDVSDDRLVRALRGSYLIYLSRQVSVTSEMRVKWRGKYLDIVDYKNAERIDELPVLTCELRP